MSRFAPAFESLVNIEGKVVVLTGGANGIGAATVRLLHERGAKIVFGDVNVTASESLVSSLNSDHVVALKTDVTSYEDNLALFRMALERYGKVDHAMSIAGISEQGNWFHPSLTIESVEQFPSRIVLDVNLLGVLYFARIASVYLRQNRQVGEDKSLILLSSLAALKESPGLPVYAASKSGVLGLMRSLRPYLPAACGIRVNAICPSMTDTALAGSLPALFSAHDMAVNKAEDVGKVIVDVTQSKGLNGKNFYVEGGRAWEVEDNIDRLEPQWLGEQCSKDLARIVKLLGDGAAWTATE